MNESTNCIEVIDRSASWKYAYFSNDSIQFVDPSGLLFGGSVNAGEYCGESATMYSASQYNNDTGVEAAFTGLIEKLASILTPKTSDMTLAALATAAYGTVGIPSTLTHFTTDRFPSGAEA